MSNVTFNNNSEYFQQLVTAAREAASDGNIAPEELSRLQQLANSSGNVLTRDEQLFIQGLSNNDNVRQLLNSNADFDPTNFQFSLEANVGRSSYQQDYNTGTPITGSQVTDLGTERFNQAMSDPSITTLSLRNDILAHSPQLQSRVDAISELLPNDKEAMIYLRELIVNRQPPLNEEQLGQILDQLTNMLNSDYDARVGNAHDLVVSALHDISAPSDIAQRNIGSCAGTCVQIQLALRNPSEYLTMLDTLAHNRDYMTVSGDIIQPNWTFTNEGTAGHYSTGRTISAMLMQNSIMDFADGARRNYDSSSTNSFDRDGLQNEEFLRALQSITGQENHQNFTINDYSPSQLMDVLRNASPSRENPILISMQFSAEGDRDSNHAVNVIGINDDTVTIINPWGQEETFSVEELQSRIYTVAAPPDSLPEDSILSNDQLQEQINNISTDSEDATAKIAGLINSNPDILNRLTIDQKTDLLSQLYDENITDQDRQAISALLYNIFQGSDVQDSYMYGEVNSGLHGDNLTDIILSVRENSDQFLDLARMVMQTTKDSNFALQIISDEELAPRFLQGLPLDDLSGVFRSANQEQLLTLLRNIDLEHINSNNKIASQALEGVFEMIQNSEEGSESREELITFLRQIQESINSAPKNVDEILVYVPEATRQGVEELTGVEFVEDPTPQGGENSNPISPQIQELFNQHPHIEKNISN